MPNNLFPYHVVGFIEVSNASISVGNVGEPIASLKARRIPSCCP